MLVDGVQFTTVCPLRLRQGKFLMPSILLALTLVFPPPLTRTLHSIALLLLLVSPWTLLMPACCIHSLYISFGISGRPSGLKTETVKPVSISPLNVAPALMYYLPCWIATLNRSYEKSGTHEGKHDVFFFLFHAIVDDPRSFAGPKLTFSLLVSVLDAPPLRSRDLNTGPCSGWRPNALTPRLPFELSDPKSLSNRLRAFRHLLLLLP